MFSHSSPILAQMVISLWAMLIDSIMFCNDVARETREVSMVLFNSSLNILNWFKSPCNSSSGFSSFNSGFIGSYNWFVSPFLGMVHWYLSLCLGNLYIKYQILPISIYLQFFLILYFI